MDDAVKKYRERRDERIKAKKARVDDQWITMRGTHVLIDDGGQVSKGPEKLKYVVKQGGGYKSRNERKYGNTDKYSKFLNGGWNASNGNRDPNAFHKSEVVHEPSKEDLKKLEKTYKSKHRRSKGYLDPKPGGVRVEEPAPSTKDKRDFPMGRSKMRSSGKFTWKQLQDEFKKLIDSKGGINKLTNRDVEEAREKLGASWEEWNNAWAYWYAGPGSKKL